METVFMEVLVNSQLGNVELLLYSALSLRRILDPRMGIAIRYPKDIDWSRSLNFAFERFVSQCRHFLAKQKQWISTPSIQSP